MAPAAHLRPTVEHFHTSMPVPMAGTRGRAIRANVGRPAPPVCKMVGGGGMAGKLLVIGGAESHDAGDDEILERFVLLAGGSDAHLVVIATASESPGQREK